MRTRFFLLRLQVQPIQHKLQLALALDAIPKHDYAAQALGGNLKMVPKALKLGRLHRKQAAYWTKSIVDLRESSDCRSARRDDMVVLQAGLLYSSGNIVSTLQKA